MRTIVTRLSGNRNNGRPAQPCVVFFVVWLVRRVETEDGIRKNSIPGDHHPHNFCNNNVYLETILYPRKHVSFR